jgi:hypothetical protein
MKVIKFTQNHSPYVAGEIASFSDEDADVRINAGVAELVKEYTVQPDRRVEEKWDESGKPTGVMESREVPKDLERNVDLPPTKAGGQPKAEENMTEEEKKRAEMAESGDVAATEDVGTMSVDAPRVNKMVDKPARKK